MGNLELGQIVFACQVPEHQGDGIRSNGNVLAIDFHADRREITLIENTVDEAAHQARFADAELTHHADFFLPLPHGRGSITRKVALRQNRRSSSLTAEHVSLSISSGAAASRAAGTPNVTSAARTFSARDLDKTALNCSVPTGS